MRSLVSTLAAALIAASILPTDASMTLTGVGGAIPSLGSCAASKAFFTRASANIAAAVTAGAPGISAWEGAVDGMICGQATPGLNTSGTNTLAKKDVLYFEPAPTPLLANMNLVQSSFTQTPGAGMATFVPNAGLTGAANTTGFADTGYTAASGQMTTSSIMLGACVLNNRTSLMTSSFLSEVGMQVTSNQFVIDVLTGSGSGSASLFAPGGATTRVGTTTNITTTKGGFFTSRTASGTFNTYVNGAVFLTAVSSTVPSLPGTGNDFFVLGLNNSGTPFSPGGLPDTVGIIVLGGGETQAQVFADEALFTTALHAVGLASNGC